jgi:hypothetical protein
MHFLAANRDGVTVGRGISRWISKNYFERSWRSHYPH